MYFRKFVHKIYLQNTIHPENLFPIFNKKIYTQNHQDVSFLISKKSPGMWQHSRRKFTNFLVIFFKSSKTYSTSKVKHLHICVENKA